MRTLTLDDIQNSPTLQSFGALAGDQVDKDNNLIRVFSQEEDFVGDTGVSLTQLRIDSSPNLQKLGAEVGDRIINNELVKTKNNSTYKQFMYGMDESGNIVSNLASILEARFPLGKLTVDFNGFNYESPNELYGKEFMESPVEERREMILRAKERELQEEYGTFFEPQDGGARTSGAVAKGILDPTTLIPMGAGIKTIAAVGGGLGVTYSVTDDMVQDGEVDPSKALVTGALSAVIPAGLVKGTRVVVNKATQKGANKTIDKAEQILNNQVSLGKDMSEPSKVLLNNGLNPAKVEKAIKVSGRKLKLPLNATQADRAIKEAITRDSSVSRLYSPTLDKYMGAISTRIRNISEPLFARLRKYEYNTHVKTQDAMNQAQPFLTEFYNLAPRIKQQISLHLFNGETKAAQDLMKGQSQSLLDSFNNQVRPLLEKTKLELQEAGHTINDIEGYFPRLVKDYDGLVESFGKQNEGVLQKALKDYADKKKIKVSNLSSEERTHVLDMTFRGYRMTTDGGKPRFVKGRQIKNLTPDQLKFYAEPEESLSMYLRGSINDIERRKFFGRVEKDDLGDIDLDSSIGAVVDDVMAKRNLNSKQQTELRDMLQARFIGGEKTTGPKSTLIRNVGYMGTIANPISALTQLGDAATSASLYGFRNTFASMFGTKEVKLIDLGLENIITKELGGDISKSAEVLTSMMNKSGFATVDRLGKQTIINAALKQARQQATKNPKKFIKDNESIYGSETQSLLADLQSGQVTDNVKLLLFNKIADIQPIALSEMPQAYLNAQTGRLAYMLKSFTLKQMDVVRNNIVKQYKAGNKKQAIKNATYLAGYLTVANTGVQATKDILLGREVRPQDIPERATFALLGVYGINKYMSDRYLQRGDIKGLAANTIIPATPVFDAGAKLVTETLSSDEEKDYSTVLKGVPVVGPMLYNWFGGGAEKFNERLDDE